MSPVDLRNDVEPTRATPIRRRSFHAGSTLALALALLLGCGGGKGGQRAHDPAPTRTEPEAPKPVANPPGEAPDLAPGGAEPEVPKPDSKPPMPAPAPAGAGADVPKPVANPPGSAPAPADPRKPFGPELKAKYAQDPLRRPIMEVFEAQILALDRDPWVYGQDFIEADPDPNPTFDEGYFSLEHTQDYHFVDGLQRPLIGTTANPPQPMATRYEGLYRSDPDFPWSPREVRRVTGFVFTGTKATPAILAKSGGFWSNFMNPYGKDRLTGTLLERMEARTWPEDAFNLRRCVFSPIAGGFVSSTRSVAWARFFALNAGSIVKGATEAYVYVFRVDQGLDCAHPAVKANALHVVEQEVAAPGMVPWSQVVAYRRIVKNPNPGGPEAPPDWAGPIHVRRDLEAKEPRAYLAIIRDLSKKSKYTKAFAAGKDWKAKLKAPGDQAYREAFATAHPDLDPSDPGLWTGQ